jgi:hypothetical protein
LRESGTTIVSLALRIRVTVQSATAMLSASVAVGLMLSFNEVVSAKLLCANESVSLFKPTALLASIPND